MPKLSILICTIPERVERFNKLYHSLPKTDEVEVLYDPRPRGALSVGKKRQHLLEMAKGDYVVFIDDDDSVSEDYVNDILSAADENPDCITFKIDCNIDGKKFFTATASNSFADWKDSPCERTPYHKTPIKRDIALNIGFKDMRFGEDYDFSKRLKQSGLIKSDSHINKVLYYYKFKYEDPKIKYGIQR